MNFTRGLVTLSIALAICLGWWLFRGTPQETPIAAAPAPVATPAPAPVIHHPPPEPAQVAAPVLPPAPVQEAPKELGPIGQVVAAQVAGDPRTQPDTAINDFMHMVDSGDYVKAAETYAQIPPNMTAADFVARLQQSPNFPQLVQMVTDTTRAAQGVTPVINDTGDVAVYNLPAQVDGQSVVRWRKINGQWYMDSIGN